MSICMAKSCVQYTVLGLTIRFEVPLRLYPCPLRISKSRSLHSSELTCEWVAWSLSIVPADTFHNRIFPSAVPAPVARVFSWPGMGHHASALTAAPCCSMCRGVLLASHMHTTLSLPPEASSPELLKARPQTSLSCAVRTAAGRCCRRSCVRMEPSRPPDESR